MSEQEQVEELAIELQETLDLDELESKIYLSLLRAGPITASALAKDLNVDRAITYRTVDKLVDRNIISTSFSSPKLCVAIEPENAFRLALEKKQEEIKKIKKQKRQLLKKFQVSDIAPIKEQTCLLLELFKGGPTFTQTLGK